LDSNNNTLKREGEPDVTFIDNDDKEINQAILDANESLKEFKEHLSENKAKNIFYSVKQKFVTNSGSNEHIWIRDIRIKDNDLVGIIDNVPVEDIGFQFEDSITIDQTNISDWLIIDNNLEKSIGGYTIIVHRNTLSDAEKIQFDAESGLYLEKR
jgi:uncharacterized protein YegJ (DUF2314 family)